MTKTTSTHRDHLHTYINDHLAAMVAEIELAARTRTNNSVGPIGAFLEGYEEILRQEKELLEKVLLAAGGEVSSAKQGAAWLTEKLGRLKPNNALFHYSQLSRVVELEVLLLAATGRRLLWKTLARLDCFDSCLTATTALELIERTTAQIRALDDYRADAAANAFDQNTDDHPGR